MTSKYRALSLASKMKVVCLFLRCQLRLDFVENIDQHPFLILGIPNIHEHAETATPTCAHDHL